MAGSKTMIFRPRGASVTENKKDMSLFMHYVLKFAWIVLNFHGHKAEFDVSRIFAIICEE